MSCCCRGNNTNINQLLFFDNNLLHSFPGLDVQKCYEILETLGDKTKQLNLDAINNLKHQFWSILEAEIQKINRGYAEREELCCKRFQMFDFRTFIISQHNVCVCTSLIIHIYFIFDVIYRI